MKTAIKDRHLRLNQEKIEKVKEIIGANCWDCFVAPLLAMTVYLMRLY